MSMVISGSGTITGLSAGGLPDGSIVQADLATGVASTGPAFSAYNTANVNLSNDVWTKVTFNTEVFDTASCYDTSNYRFTPNVAGYYLISATTWVTWDSASPRGMGTAIYKNGSAYAQTKVLTGTGYMLYGNTPVTSVIYMNGSTDYLEVYATCVLGTTVYVQGGTSSISYWSGSLMRAA